MFRVSLGSQVSYAIAKRVSGSVRDIRADIIAIIIVFAAIAWAKPRKGYLPQLRLEAPKTPVPAVAGIDVPSGPFKTEWWQETKETKTVKQDQSRTTITTTTKKAFKWDWKDWGGLLLCIATIYAIAQGISPADLISALGKIFHG